MDIVKKDTVQKLYSKEGYFDRFYELAYEMEYDNYRDLWLVLESEFESIFGTNKYKTYQSFKNAKQKDTITRQARAKLSQ